MNPSLPARNASVLPVILSLCLFTASCGEQSPAEERHGALNESFPLEVRGWDGELFRLEAPPRRLLPTNAATTDFLAALVEPEDVVALPFTAEVYSTFETRRDEWLARPVFPELSAAELLGYEPDLVVTQSWQTAGAIRHLRAAGVPVLVLPLETGLGEVRESIEALGVVLDQQRRATELLADLDRCVEALAETAQRRSHLRLLGYSNYGTGGWAAGAETTVDVIIATAGMQNAAREIELENWQEIDYERLLELDPDLLVVEVEPDGTIGPTEKLLRGEDMLAGLGALKNDGMVRLERRLNTTSSHQMVAAAEELARLVDRWLEERE
jgi:iron complex transport system substrate-binding protein